jgi:hypothetical protein
MRRVAVITATQGDADQSANCNLCHVELATPYVVRRTPSASHCQRRRINRRRMATSIWTLFQIICSA